MTDLEIVKRCAEAIGWKHLGAIGPQLTPEELELGPSEIERRYPKTHWCLSGHNDWWLSPTGDYVCEPCYGSVPNPLTDDAQAMALVVKLGLMIEPDGHPPVKEWCVHAWHNPKIEWVQHTNENLNRAICEAAAGIP